MKLFKEPLVHFLVLGALIFLLARGRQPASSGPTAIDPWIRIPAPAVSAMAEDFHKLHDRPPTAAELRGLVRQRVIDEACVKQALRDGLDRDDPIVRRRLIEKMRVVAAGAVAVPEPDDVTLAAFLGERPELFREDARLSLRQIRFDPAKLGDDPQAELGEQLRRLEAGERVDGHPTLLPAHRADAPLRSLAATFGSEFAAALSALPVGRWSGPLRSGFGWHLVKVESRTEGSVPPLERIRDEVRQAWELEEGNRRLEAFHEDLLDDYEVTIEWPDGMEDAP